jgi:hypothetical protein
MRGPENNVSSVSSIQPEVLEQTGIILRKKALII